MQYGQNILSNYINGRKVYKRSFKKIDGRNLSLYGYKRHDENPLKDAARIFKEHNFQTPIDEIDAASRIVDPIFQGVLYGSREFGKFFKNYTETEW